MAALSMVIGLSSAAQARPLPFQDRTPSQYPGAPSPAAARDDNSPYAMTYTDEVARSLGVKNGHMDFFSLPSNSSYLPSVSAGVDRDGAMLRMRWHPGD